MGVPQVPQGERPMGVAMPLRAGANPTGDHDARPDLPGMVAVEDARYG